MTLRQTVAGAGEDVERPDTATPAAGGNVKWDDRAGDCAAAPPDHPTPQRLLS